ncbi:Acyltransferase family protein [Sphingomonas laterariae]|uniref:Acyltransferase family protein n=2 Tax=Edaphosphingomonas laterariae TaxID=861865 RepID=A0A239FVS1_9SPHN|nr:Acyltransferase family protein [Sphingomonas laterariae]
MLSPWDWHVNAEHPVAWIVYLLIAMNPWRMMLLFLVSGYAARAMLARAPTIAGFARSRTARLVIPLLFGATFIVVPQAWVELQQKLGYPHGLIHFWLHDYFGFGARDYHAFGFFHLWFVAYILVYSLLVAVAAALLSESATARLQAGFARAFSGWRLILLPIAWLLLVRLVLLPGLMPTNRVADDLPGHLVYLPAFLFGFGLARGDALWPDIRRLWRPALALVIAGYALLAWRMAGNPGAESLASFYGGELGPASLMGWGAIILLLGLADRRWNHDHRWRATLTEAVFPVYLIHQTLIVLIGWWLVRHHWGAGPEFLVLIAGTALGCWLFYALGRRSGPLRPLIGLPRDGRKSVGGPQSPIRSIP